MKSSNEVKSKKVIVLSSRNIHNVQVTKLNTRNSNSRNDSGFEKDVKLHMDDLWMRYSFVSPDYLTVEEAREWVFCIAYFLVAPPPTRSLTPDEVDGMVVEEVTEVTEEISEIKEEIDEDSDSDIIISNIDKPEFVQAGVSSSEEGRVQIITKKMNFRELFETHEESEDEEETAEIEDETPIVEDLPPVEPPPTPARDHRTQYIISMLETAPSRTGWHRRQLSLTSI